MKDTHTQLSRELRRRISGKGIDRSIYMRNRLKSIELKQEKIRVDLTSVQQLDLNVKKVMEYLSTISPSIDFQIEIKFTS